MAASNLVRLDDLLVRNLGQFGLYQKVLYFLVGVPSIFTAMHALSWTFSGAKMNHRCLYPGENQSSAEYKPSGMWHETASNLTSHDECTRISGVHVGQPLPHSNSSLTMEGCLDGYAWDHSDISYSAVERWSLVCDRDIIIATVQALYFVGQMLGSICFGLVSDKIGRKPCFIIAILIQIICGSCMSVAPSWGLMTFLRAATGFAHLGVFMLAIVIGAELVGPKYRVGASIFCGAFWSVGLMIMGGLSYPLRDYRQLQLVISLPAIVLLSFWFIIPESPRWLMSQGRYQEVDKILAQVAKWNGKPRLASGWYTNLEKEEPRKLPYLKSLWVLFKTPRLRMRTLIFFVLWAVVTMSYYGLAINPSFMGGDNRLGFILSGLLEIPGLLVLLLVNYIGRRIMGMAGFLLAAICLGLTLAVPPTYPVVNLLLVVIGKSGLTWTFALVYIWTPEAYPTMIRNTATGSASMIGRVGGIAASYFSLKLANDHPEIVALTLAALAALAGILCMFVPETTGEPLMETIEEAERLGIGQPFLITGCANQKLASQRLYENRKVDLVMDQSTH